MNTFTYSKLIIFAKDLVQPSSSDVGIDLFSAYEYIIPPHDRVLCETDIQIQLPIGTYGKIAPRSGLALNYGIDVGGVIDPGYRGNAGIILFNHSDVPYVVNIWDKIAQIICEKVRVPEIVQVVKLNENTERGRAGFGSTSR